MTQTLHDHLLMGGEWPPELERIEKNGFTVARCTCGRVSGPTNFYYLKDGAVKDRLSGRVRRSRMRREVKRYAEQAAKQRLREPEVSPSWVCGWCVGAMRRAG